MNHIEYIEARLRKAMDYAKARGYRIVRGLTFDLRTRCCCAIGAFCVADLTCIDDFHTIAKSLDLMNELEVERFITGFDEGLMGGVDPYQELGNKLALEYIGPLPGEDEE